MLHQRLYCEALNLETDPAKHLAGSLIHWLRDCMVDRERLNFDI